MNDNVLDYFKKLAAELRTRPTAPDMLFMTRKTWIAVAKHAIGEGIRVEYRPYLHARRFRFLGGIPVRVWEGAEEGKIYGFNTPRPPLYMNPRTIKW